MEAPGLEQGQMLLTVPAHLDYIHFPVILSLLEFYRDNFLPVGPVG